MEADFVVIGAGSSGCLLANRLSADPNHQVILVEAGGSDWYPWIHIPVGYFKTMGNPMTDWRYQTQSDPGLNGRVLKWPRGRVMGGCSSINGLLYVRGQAEDYDDWACPGWEWENVAPLFKRLENWSGEASESRGTQGGLHVEQTQLRRNITDAWQNAAINAGYPYNADYNSGDQHGVAPFQMTIHKGLRCSAAKAFITPISSRSNLRIIKNATAKKLIFQGSRCVGVELKKAGKLITLKSKQEVVLSAGSIGSPQLLMLSGIADAEATKRIGVEVKVDLPGVGKNLQDHLQARPVYRCNASTINTETNSLFKQGMIAMRYLLTRQGPMTMAASLGTGFLKTKYSENRPDIQFHIQPFSADSPEKGAHEFDAFTASVLQMRPMSRGHLELDVNDPEGHPLIHPNYLSETLDQQTLVEGIRINRKICRTAPASDLITEENGVLETIDDEDEAGLLDWARNHSTTIYHPTGTCKMGADRTAVVDHQLRVHGIAGLRVADCSIMPQIISGNTNAPAMMIAEKCAELILQGVKP